MRPSRLLAALPLSLALFACAGNKEAPAPTPAPAPAPAPKPVTQSPPPVTRPAPPAPAASAPEPERPSRAALKVRFGIMPGNYDDGSEGVLVDDVFPNTSAADAGIKPGDRLMTWDGKKIQDVGQWMQYMMPANPGDVVEVGILRDGKTIPLKVTLKGG